MAEPMIWLPAPAWLDPANWTWRLSVVIVLATLLTSYLLGAIRISQKGLTHWVAPKVCWWLLGFTLLVLALLSPLDELGGLFFSWHMVQHLALLYAAPLLLAGWPLTIAVWSLPSTARRFVGRLLRRGGVGVWVLERVTRLPVALGAGIVSLWIWHYPPLYDAVLTRRWLHDLEHITFFLGALLYWWPIVDAPPMRRRLATDAWRALYLVLGGTQSGILGALVTFWPDVLYHRYLVEVVEHSRLMADQVFGGLVMWLSGPLVVGVLALATLGREAQRVAETRVLASH